MIINHLKRGIMTKISISISMILLLITSFNLHAQNVGINSDGSSPDSKAMLDVKSSDKGVLLPRIALTGKNDNTTIISPTTSLLIYNTATAGVGANAVTPGFYYYNGTEWAWIGSSSSDTHYVGELYGGGVVFWVDHTGEHGLICSMINLSTSQAWSNIASTLIGASAQSDWNGSSNTAAVIAQAGHTASAAKLCDDYTNANYGTGTYSDWYLPTQGELSDLWNNFKAVQKALESDGDGATIVLTRASYWSSAEHSASAARTFNFADGSLVHENKSWLRYVRAIRAF